MTKTFIKRLVHYHPTGIILNTKFEETLDTTADWILKKTGISERKYMDDYEGTFPVYEIAKRAFLKLHANGDLNLKEIDLLMSCSTHDDLHYPNPANLLSEEFSINCAALQLKTACTSVAYGLAIAKAFLETNAHKNILMINGEPFTRFVDFGDRSSSVLFGDASTALQIGTDHGVFRIIDVETGGIGIKLVEASGTSDTSHFTPREFVSGVVDVGKPIANRRRNSDKKFQQDGKLVVDFVKRNIPGHVDKFLNRNNQLKSKINYFIAHQSNLNMMNELFSELNLTSAVHLHNIENFGNTSSAGWISVLSQNQNEMSKGEIVLVTSFGAGMTWANILLERV